MNEFLEKAIFTTVLASFSLLTIRNLCIKKNCNVHYKNYFTNKIRVQKTRKPNQHYLLTL